MISSFPSFKKFQLEDTDSVERITKKFPPYCEYSLAALLTWYNIEIAVLNDNLILMMPDFYDDHTSAYSLFGTTSIEKTIQTVLSTAKKYDPEPSLIFVPEPVIKAIQHHEGFICEEDRDLFDYIVSIEEMATLKGGRNQTKRELCKGFFKRYPGYSFQMLDLKDHKTQKDIEELYKTWRDNAGKRNDFLNHEYTFLTKLYEFADQLPIISHGLYVDSSLIGYSVLGLVNKPYAIHYYMKTDIRFRGVTTTFNKLLGEYLFTNGYLYLNLEADLGSEGLRNSKMLRHPVQFLKKYSIQLT